MAQRPRPLPSRCCTTWRLLLLTVHTGDIERDQRENIPFWVHMNLPPKMLSYWLFREDLQSLPQTGSQLLHPSWKSIFPLGSLHTSCGSSVPSGLQGESPKENGADHRASQFLTSNSAILSTIAHLGHIFLKLTRILVPYDVCIFCRSSSLENWDIHLWTFIYPVTFFRNDPSTLSPNPAC